MADHKITVGLSTIIKKEVGVSDTLPARDSAGILDFLISTPAVLTMVIQASSEMLDPLLPEGFITVGKTIELSHERPTMVGETISLILTVTKIDGTKILLDIAGHDATGQICKGTYERHIVDKNFLLDAAYRRASNMK
jgi:fluoroacetyl-CoA thioesterase